MTRLKYLMMASSALVIAITSAGCGDKTSGVSQSTASAAGALASIASGTDLSGTWKVNKELSDSPPERGPRFERMRERHSDKHDSGSFVMTIAQTDSTVSITGPRGRTRNLYTDGRVMEPEHERAPEGIEIRATWPEAGELKIERTGPRGGKRSETFSLSADGSQLFSVVQVQRPDDDDAKTFRRVFDAVSSGR